MPTITCHPYNENTLAAVRLAYRGCRVIGESLWILEIKRAWAAGDGELLAVQLEHVRFELGQRPGTWDLWEALGQSVYHATQGLGRMLRPLRGATYPGNPYHPRLG